VQSIDAPLKAEEVMEGANTTKLKMKEENLSKNNKQNKKQTGLAQSSFTGQKFNFTKSSTIRAQLRTNCELEHLKICFM
jgi:hypothetical protein